MPGDDATRERLDMFLARRGLLDSRARARDAVLRGTVRVNGVVALKPGQSVPANADVALDDPASGFVSRSALKLAAALDAFAVPVAGRTALDIGASTGGFTEVLLDRGAGHVISIDVGHGQLHPRIAGDARVTAIEGLNARDLQRAHLAGRRIDLVVADVSFISLRLALPPALDLAEAGAAGVFLVKPQFEAGRERIGRGGLLRDPDNAPRLAEKLGAWLGQQAGWRTIGIAPSPISGGDGNREFLLHGCKT